MRTRRFAPLIAASAVALVALIAAVAGPVQVGEPVIPFDVRQEEPTPAPTLEPAEDETEDEEVPANPFTVGIVVYVVAVGLVGLAVFVMLVTWSARWLLNWRRPAQPPGAADPHIAISALQDAAELAVFEAESARPGEAADAVVACWVILEQAAAAAGTPRAAPQTPTEFTVTVLTEHRADPAAVATLLALYHRARFGAESLPDEDADRAARALRTISASLATAAGAGPGSRP